MKNISEFIICILLLGVLGVGINNWVEADKEPTDDVLIEEEGFVTQGYVDSAIQNALANIQTNEDIKVENGCLIVDGVRYQLVEHGKAVELGERYNGIKYEILAGETEYVMCGLYLALVPGYEAGGVLVSIDGIRSPENACPYMQTIDFMASPGTPKTATLTVAPRSDTYGNASVVDVTAGEYQINLYQILVY